MSLFTSFDINASGLTAQRCRMDIISENIANANTTRTQNGDPYVRKVVYFEEKGVRGSDTFSHVLNSVIKNYAGKGVKVAKVLEDRKTPQNMVYDPSHPDADENGYVMYPNVNIITEMTNLIDASRSYEANATAFEAAKAMTQQGLSIGQG